MRIITSSTLGLSYNRDVSPGNAATPIATPITATTTTTTSTTTTTRSNRGAFFTHARNDAVASPSTASPSPSSFYTSSSSSSYSNTWRDVGAPRRPMSPMTPSIVPPTPSTTPLNPCDVNVNNVNVNTNASKSITATSAVLRLGRAGASTDHSSVLFDVDLNTGVIGRGTTNALWYQVRCLHIFHVYVTYI